MLARSGHRLIPLRDVLCGFRACSGKAGVGAGGGIKDGEIGIISGAPEEIYSRRVTIYAPAKSAGQAGMGASVHGGASGPHYKIWFDTEPKWENPLMGWASTADPVEQVARSALNFHTKEQAMDFCRRHGWQFEVREDKPYSKTRPKTYLGYGDNFSVKKKGYPVGGLTSEGEASSTAAATLAPGKSQPGQHPDSGAGKPKKSS